MSSSSSSGNRFADYFVICGLDLTSGLEPDRLSGDNLHNTPLERPYKSKVLAHYPDKVPWNPFDEDAVNMLCLPKGLQFRTQKHALDPSFHSFIITREDGTRTYGCALTFFEEVPSRKICSAMQTLQAMHLAEVSSGNVLHPATRLVVDPGGGGVGSNTRSLPRSFKLSGHPNSMAANSFYDISKDVLFVSKSVCLILQLPFIHACRQFLLGLHRLIVATEPPPLHLESYVHNILYEVPVPSSGRSMEFHCFGKNIVCQRPGPNELPLLDYSLREFIEILGVENVLPLFTCVLLENQVLLYSKDYHKLMLVAECITMLLFPFTWQHVYVPILPASLLHFLDAPVPYIMGLHHGASEDRSQLQIPGEANLCFVDIDNQVVEPPEDLPQFPQRLEFLQEIVDVLVKHDVPVSMRSGLDRNLNERSSHGYVRCGSIPRRRRKGSWSFDSDSGMSSTESSISGSHSSIGSIHSNRMEILQQSEAVQRIAAIAKRTGVITSLEDLRKPSRVDGEGNLRLTRELTEEQKYLEGLKFNNAVREIFLNRFTHMFSSYEHFVIQPNQDMEQWLSSRDQMQNFDKATFLSDQHEPHLPFLSRFIETQMFATLIDNKIMAQWEDADPYLKLFDARIKILKDRYTPSYEPCTSIQESESLIEKRATIVDLTAPMPQPVELPLEPRQIYKPGFFPLLDAEALNREPVKNKSKRRASSQFHRKERHQQHLEHSLLQSDQREKYIQEARNKSMRQPKLSDMTPAIIAQTNWKFVEQLLKECKTKTKRMLVEKMGQEAVELGHGEVSITGVEENTLIASLCDLLERIWSHGLQSKQGKSALWSHLLSYQEVEECNDRNKPINPNFLTPVVHTPPSSISIIKMGAMLSIKTSAISLIFSQLAKFDLSSMALESDVTPRREKRDRERDKKRTTPKPCPELPCLRPLPISLTFDMRNVQAMTEIKTEIGYARAWVRLSLEKKLLSKHLKKLLSDHELLKTLYKRYAFLRSDDEKEQFLYHLLSLNAVDYFCFTNTFTNTIIPYRVVIFPSRKFSASTTSANAWVCISGTLGETGIQTIPKQTLELLFQNKNLGVLTTLRIGHDNTGMSPKWMVEHVLVRNEVTSHTYKFPCGRWLGKGVDDGSTERLLVGELVPPSTDNEELMETCRTPPRCRSPNMPRRPSETRLSVSELQQMLADAVNNIVKYYYKPEKERGNLTILLCGEMGLVYCLEQVFLYNFKSSRLFGRHLYLWDYFVRVQSYFETVLQEEEDKAAETKVPRDSHEHVIVMQAYCNLVGRINAASNTMGKDGKFQVFICLAAREHLLHRMMLHVASTPVTVQMYEDQSFLKDPNLITFLIQILEALSDFNIVLESSLTKGIDN